MSFSRFPRQVMRDPRFCGRTRVLGALGGCAGPDGIAIVKIETLAVHTGLSTKTVKKWIAALEADGYVTKLVRRGERGRLLTNQYSITYAEIDLSTSLGGDTVQADDHSTPQEGAMETQPDSDHSTGQEGAEDHGTSKGCRDHSTPQGGDGSSAFSSSSPLNSSSPSDRGARGTRLSPDWTLPAELWNWAAKEGLSAEAIEREADKFRDHWLAKAGKDAAKADWPAAWRNWVRRGKDFNIRSSAPNQRAAGSPIMDALRRRVQAMCADSD